MTDKEIEPKDLAIILLLVGVLLLVIFSVLIYNRESTPEPQALLDSEIYDWMINLYDDDEIISQYWIYNYGDKQANNIEVRCILYDGEYNVLSQHTENIGNLASNSNQFGEMIYSNRGLREGEDSVSLCFVESCDDCVILWKNIPELVELYGN